MKPDYSQKLEEFEEYLKKVPEIIAVYYTGSTASKKWDKYSDIDIDIVVKDKDYEKIRKKLLKLLSWWGEIKFVNHYKDSDETYAFVGEDYLKVEIDPIRLSDIKPCWKARHIRIAYDKEGTLTKVYRISQKEKKPKLEHEEFLQLFLDTRSNFFYIARHFMRGQKLSAASEIGSMSGDLFIHLGKIKGYEAYENLRNAEKHLNKKEWNFLKTTSCKSLEKNEVQRALRANWKFMKYLERMYEKKTGNKLGLKCDDKEILKNINKIFEGK